MSTAAVFRTVRELGFNARRLALLGQVPRFLRDLRQWRRRGGAVGTLYPVLSDWRDQAGSTSSPYFHQDLLVARKVFAAAPRRHIDVGSRIDGFVAHIAVFREIEVLDIRPMTSRIMNVKFLQADLMQGAPQLRHSTDSVSCLHALEHFGLGRYGDPIDPEGHLRGFRALIDMLAPGGTLYISFPIGKAVVEFNAHRVFDCREILSWPGCESLQLKSFDYVDDAGELHEQADVRSIDGLHPALVHGCGIYSFRKL